MIPDERLTSWVLLENGLFHDEITFKQDFNSVSSRQRRFLLRSFGFDLIVSMSRFSFKSAEIAAVR